MKCIHCQGDMARNSIPFHIDRKCYHITLDVVPAWVCTQCGEAYFDEVEVEAIQSFLRTLDERVAHFNLVSPPPRVAATSAADAG
jgi:YgiT-type zinc finger domain-containing protein